MKHTINMLAALALATLLTGAVAADPPADKGKGNEASAHGQSGEHGQAGGNMSGGSGNSANNSGDHDNDHHDNGKSGMNHGQVVSECNHRANDRHMKGQDRKQWVEWCEDHGARFKYENRAWNTDRSCYQKADDRNLSGDKRRTYVHNCLTKADPRRYDYTKYPATVEPRGKDVLGKSK